MFGISDGNQTEVLWGNGRLREGWPFWRREQTSWLGKWGPAAVQRHLNQRKKSDVSSTPMTILQNTLQCETQKCAAMQNNNTHDDIKKVYQSLFSLFLSDLNSGSSTCCFSQPSAPQQQLMSSRRNFLKEKQRDDISVSGENIINNKQRWKWQLDKSDMFVKYLHGCVLTGFWFMKSYKTSESGRGRDGKLGFWSALLPFLKWLLFSGGQMQQKHKLNWFLVCIFGSSFEHLCHLRAELFIVFQKCAGKPTEAVWAYHRWRMWGISTCQTCCNNPHSSPIKYFPCYRLNM